MGTVALTGTSGSDYSPDRSYKGPGGCDRTGTVTYPAPCSSFYVAPTYTTPQVCSYFNYRVRNGTSANVRKVTFTGVKTTWLDYNAVDMTKQDQYQTGEILDAQDTTIDGGFLAPGSTGTVHVAWCSKSGPPREDRTPVLFVDVRSASLGWE